jgi:hypothetical protein
MLAQLQCRQRGKRMSMFAGADNHCVEFVRVIKDPAEIGTLSSAVMRFRSAVKIIRVDVAEGRNVFGGDGLEIATASPPTTDYRNAQLVKTRDWAGSCGADVKPCGDG